MSLVREYEIKKKLDENFGVLLLSPFALLTALSDESDWPSAVFLTSGIIFLNSVIIIIRLVYYFIWMKIKDKQDKEKWLVMDIMDM